MAGLRIGSLCSGYRGLDMAVEAVFGASTAWVSDVDPGANRILAHHWPDTPNIGDLTTTRWEDVEPIDILCGGYPCQPFSTAGLRKGTEDERHIWPYIADALRVLRPRVAVFENVAGHLRLGFDAVLADLARLGFDAEWCVASASEVGAPHQRKRLFLLAVAADAARVGRGEGRPEPARQQRRPDSALDSAQDWGRFAPAVARWEAVTGHRAPWATDDRGRLAPAFVEWMMGLPAGHVTEVPELTRAQQLKALGNGVVPQQAEAAIRLLYARATEYADEPFAVAA